MIVVSLVRKNDEKGNHLKTVDEKDGVKFDLLARQKYNFIHSISIFKSRATLFDHHSQEHERGSPACVEEESI